MLNLVRVIYDPGFQAAAAMFAVAVLCFGGWIAWVEASRRWRSRGYRRRSGDL